MLIFSVWQLLILLLLYSFSDVLSVMFGGSEDVEENLCPFIHQAVRRVRHIFSILWPFQVIVYIRRFVVKFRWSELFDRSNLKPFFSIVLFRKRKFSNFFQNFWMREANSKYISSTFELGFPLSNDKKFGFISFLVFPQSLFKHVHFFETPGRID